MSDDFLSSFKGAGVIGTFLGAFVLVGFVFMSFLVFDPRFAGGWESDRGAVSRQEKELDRLEGESSKLREKADIQREREAASLELETIQEKNKSQSARIESISRAVSDARSANELSEAAFRSYIAKVRATAAGEVLPDLEMLDGKVYTSPTIIEVTAAGLHLRHRDGTARALFVNLPEGIRRRFRFDPDEMASLLGEERRGNQALEDQIEGELSEIFAARREARIKFLKERIPFLKKRIASSQRREAGRYYHATTLWALQEREAADKEELSNIVPELERLEEASGVGESR